MAVDPEKFLKAKRFTADFTFNEGTKQVLMKPASETVAGKVELATEAETLAGTDAVRAVTPVNLAAALAALGDKYVTGVAGYNTTTHTLVLTLHGGTTVDIPMTAVIADLGSSLPAATTIVVGATRFATIAETYAGTINDAAVTPDALKYVLDNAVDMFGD